MLDGSKDFARLNYSGIYHHFKPQNHLWGMLPRIEVDVAWEEEFKFGHRDILVT